MTIPEKIAKYKELMRNISVLDGLGAVAQFNLDSNETAFVIQELLKVAESLDFSLETAKLNIRVEQEDGISKFHNGLFSIMLDIEWRVLGFLEETPDLIEIYKAELREISTLNDGVDFELSFDKIKDISEKIHPDNLEYASILDSDVLSISSEKNIDDLSRKNKNALWLSYSSYELRTNALGVLLSSNILPTHCIDAYSVFESISLSEFQEMILPKMQDEIIELEFSLKQSKKLGGNNKAGAIVLQLAGKNKAHIFLRNKDEFETLPLRAVKQISKLSGHELKFTGWADYFFCYLNQELNPLSTSKS